MVPNARFAHGRRRSGFWQGNTDRLAISAVSAVLVSAAAPFVRNFIRIDSLSRRVRAGRARYAAVSIRVDARHRSGFFLDVLHHCRGGQFRNDLASQAWRLIRCGMGRRRLGLARTAAFLRMLQAFMAFRSDSFSTVDTTSEISLAVSVLLFTSLSAR